MKGLASPRSLVAMGSGLVVAAAFAYWHFQVKPQAAAGQRLYDATTDLWALYDLQMDNKKSAGTYVDGLDALLATAKDGRALKARLARHVDLNTAAVVGDAEKFKIELNLLDEDRTLLKIKGPIGRRLWTGTDAAPAQEAPPPSDGMGAPVDR